MRIGRTGIATAAAVIAGALAAAPVGPAHAASLTFNLTGEVFSVDPGLGGLVEVGNPFSGSFTFDSEAIDASAGGDTGTYNESISSLSFVVGLLSESRSTGLATNGIIVLDGIATPSGDSYNAKVDVPFPFDATGLEFLRFDLVALDAEGGIFASDALPTNPSFLLDPAFTDGPNDELFIEITYLAEGPLASFRVTIDQASVVPEPGTLAVLGVGLAGLGWVRRRKAA